MNRCFFFTHSQTLQTLKQAFNQGLIKKVEKCPDCIHPHCFRDLYFEPSLEEELQLQQAVFGKIYERVTPINLEPPPN